LNELPRAAFLPDTFHEVNGVAHTSRHLESFARRRQVPFLSVHCGERTATIQDGAVTVMELKRGPLRLGLDAHLDYDLFLMRYADRIMAELKKFGAQLIHVTGPGDLGTVACYAAWRMNLPLVISWHTSLHEYAGRRLERVLGLCGARASRFAGHTAEKLSMDFLRWFYSRARVVLAPNQDLVQMLSEFTRRPVFLMQRGVETDLFHPQRRSRANGKFRIGYVGRLTPEKNVRFLCELSSALTELGRSDFEFVVVGQGNEEAWLRENLPNVSLTGVLRGERLAEAYADMDLFVFPSTTDTFGNVVLEAMGSGVPAVVTDGGGPKFLVQHGVTGFVAPSNLEFIRHVNALMTDSDLRRSMAAAARRHACSLSWDAVFENVFRAYQHCLEISPRGIPAAASLSRVAGKP
jgi:glycosyltransferase involved in cell wall biosynthesis